MIIFSKNNVLAIIINQVMY